MKTREIIAWFITGAVVISVAAYGIKLYKSKKNTDLVYKNAVTPVVNNTACEPLPAKPIVPIQDGMSDYTQHKLQALNNYADYMKSLYLGCCSKSFTKNK